MVGLCSKICRLFGHSDSHDKEEIKDLIRVLRGLIPIAEGSLDNRLEAEHLRRRFGVSSVYPGVA